MNDTLRKKYKNQLAEAHLFLSSETRSSPRKHWTSSQRSKWLMRQKECPTCNIELTLENLTKEHIHPLCLGGLERDDNVIAMCNECNRCRNEIMVAVLGGSVVKSFRSRWPANKTSIEEFIVWCCATVYNDSKSVSQLGHIDDKFRKCRGLEQRQSIENVSSKKTNTKSTTGSNRQTAFNRIRNLSVHFFGKFISTKDNDKQEEVIDCVNCKIQLSIPVGYGGKIKCKACETIFSNSEEVAETPVEPKAEAIVEPKKKKAQPKSTSKEKPMPTKKATKEPAPVKPPTEGEFPVYSKVNTSRGLRLPREPVEMLNAIQWFLANESEYENWDEMRKDFQNSEIVSLTGRTVRTLLQLINSVGIEKKENGLFDLKELREKKRNMGFQDIINNIERNCKNLNIINESDYPGIEIYFKQLRLLSAINREKTQDSKDLKEMLLEKFRSIIAENDREQTDLDYAWRLISDWTKTVGINGIKELKRKLGFSVRYKISDMIIELYGDELPIGRKDDKFYI